jgi:hypothetical protein
MAEFHRQKAAGRVQRLLPFLEKMVDEGVIGMWDVAAIKYSHQGGIFSD